MESQMLIYFGWFVIGAVTHKTLSYIMDLSSSINIFNETLQGCLIMLKRIDEQRLISLKINHDKMKESERPEEEVEQSISTDIQNHYLWREMMIGVIIVCCPKNIKAAVTFKDWSSAMKLLKQ
jgi:hypothetical protein